MRISWVSLAVLVLAYGPVAIARADPFNVDLKKLEKHLAAAREDAKQPIDPRRLLDARVPETNAIQIALKDTLEFLSSVHAGRRIVVDWHALEAAGVEPATPVTLNTRDTPLRDLLSKVLRDSGADRRGFHIEVVDELIVISSPQRVPHIKRLLAHTTPEPTTKPTPLAARVAVVQADPCLGDSFGLSLLGQPLEKALETLSAHTSATVRVDWDALQPLALARDSRVEYCAIPNGSLRGALVVLFLNLGPIEHLTWREQNGVVLITSTCTR